MMGAKELLLLLFIYSVFYSRNGIIHFELPRCSRVTILYVIYSQSKYNHCYCYHNRNLRSQTSYGSQNANDLTTCIGIFRAND